MKTNQIKDSKNKDQLIGLDKIKFYSWFYLIVFFVAIICFIAAISLYFVIPFTWFELNLIFNVFLWTGVTFAIIDLVVCVLLIKKIKLYKNSVNNYALYIFLLVIGFFVDLIGAIVAILLIIKTKKWIINSI